MIRFAHTRGIETRLLALAAAFALVLAAPPAQAEKSAYLYELPQISSFSFEPGDPASSEQFLVASYAGLFAVTADGRTRRLGGNIGALTELVRHPAQPNTLLASGYRTKDKKLGVLRSEDGGETWQTLNTDPVAFLAMAYSPSEPAIVYGVDGTLQVSTDGGESWRVVGEKLPRTFDLAVSPRDAKTLFLGTVEGLLKSHDGGKSWQQAHSAQRPATMVHMAANGAVHAFIYGVGLLFSPDDTAANWTILSSKFADRALMTMAVDPGNPRIMLGAADTGAAMISKSGGRRWTGFEGHQNAIAARIEAGRKLYEENCAACHGERAVGENPADIYALDENKLPVAPPLDDSAHGWHHPDDQLVEIILNGSERNERMIPWKEQDMTAEQARDVVAYLKSLWNFRSLACQGQRHMTCMRQ